MATRLNVNINDETSEAIQTYMDKRALTATEIVRRSVSVLKFFEDAVDDDKEIYTVDSRGKRTRIVLF